MRSPFRNGSVTAARFGLILILAIAAAAGLALPLRRLTRRRAVGTAEAAFPQFEQRLITFAERDGQDPFIELLAGDTLEVAQSAEPKQFVTDRRLWISLGTAVGAFAILIWMIAAGPGFLGYGASLLWTGPHRDKPALYDLRVTPGDAVVRRHADQMISALPTGLRSPSVKLYARFQSSSKWEEIAMQPTAAGSFAGGYQFLFAGLPENVEYYVTAGAMTSKHYQHSRHRSALGEADSRHLSLPRLDRHAVRDRRARRRSARRHRHRGRTRRLHRPAASGRPDPAR